MGFSARILNVVFGGVLFADFILIITLIVLVRLAMSFSLFFMSAIPAFIVFCCLAPRFWFPIVNALTVVGNLSFRKRRKYIVRAYDCFSRRGLYRYYRQHSIACKRNYFAAHRFQRTACRFYFYYLGFIFLLAAGIVLNSVSLSRRNKPTVG